MSKSYKLKDNNYIDSSSVSHNKVQLNEVLDNLSNGKVDKTTTIAGIDLQNNITASELASALKVEILKSENPVGHIRMETTNTNPSTYLGFGTWVLWGAGRVPVGVDTSDTDFSTVEKTGGEKQHTLTIQEIPSHTHTFTGVKHTHTFTGKAHSHTLNSHTHTYLKVNSPTGGPSTNSTGSTTLTTNQIPAHNHSVPINITKNEATGFGLVSSESFQNRVMINGNNYNTGSAGGGQGHTHTLNSHTHTTSTTSTNTGAATGNTGNATQGGTNAETIATGSNSTTGGGNGHNNLQPYITCYMWKRTA